MLRHFSLHNRFFFFFILKDCSYGLPTPDPVFSHFIHFLRPPAPETYLISSGPLQHVPTCPETEFHQMDTVNVPLALIMNIQLSFIHVKIMIVPLLSFTLISLSRKFTKSFSSVDLSKASFHHSFLAGMNLPEHIFTYKTGQIFKVLRIHS